MSKFIKEWFRYWRDFFAGLVADDRYDVYPSPDDDKGDTPIFDQLEREWANKGRFSLTLGSK